MQEGHPYNLRRRFRWKERSGYAPEDEKKGTDPTVPVEQTYNVVYRKRTPCGVVKLCIFFLLFYAGIVILWTICYTGFRKTMKSVYPKWTNDQPSFSFEPYTGTDPIIEYDASTNSVNAYIEEIQQMLGKFGTRVDVGNCTKELGYGYLSNSPCVFLKANRIYGFKLDAFMSESDLPKSAPKDLREHLQTLTPAEIQERLWISCKINNQTSNDIKIDYYPNRYIHGKALQVFIDKPKNSSDEWSFDDRDYERIVAIKLNNLKLKETYAVRCYFWAKNIQIDDEGIMGRGMIRFKIQVTGT